MAETYAEVRRRLMVDKEAMRKVIAEVNKEMGFVPNPDATPEKVQQMMIAQGIRPEDNIFSCGIIAARDEE